MSIAGQRAAGSTREDLGLVDAMVQLTFVVYELVGRVAARHEVSVIQLRLLGILRDREPGMAQLAALLHLDKSSMTGLVDRAQRRGLVTRVPVPEDRRAVRVALTPEGQAVAAAGANEVRQELARVTDTLGEADAARLSALASQLVHRAAALEGFQLA